jgi:hypothetical protein
MKILVHLILSAGLGLLVCAPSFAQAPARKIKGLRQPMVRTDRGLVRATLKDIKGGAVVVVEEQAYVLPWWPAKGDFRMLRPALAPAPWMDTTRVVENGNPVALLYPLGWDRR